MYTNTLVKAVDFDIKEPKFQTALEFIQRKDLVDLPVGWIELEHGVRASVQEYETMDPQTLDFETHDLYYDLQYQVKGEEFIGVCPREGLVNKIPYEKENDIEFYNEPVAKGGVVMKEGTYVLLTVEDAHKPRCFITKPMQVKKIVVKIPV